MRFPEGSFERTGREVLANPLAQVPSRDLHLAPDRRRTWDFPSGSYEFMGAKE